MDENVNKSAVPTSQERELELINQNLKELIQKVDGSKKRDVWDRFQILGSFVSTVLIAGVGLYYTIVFDREEAKRNAVAQKEQITLGRSEANRNKIAQQEQLALKKIEEERNKIAQQEQIALNKREEERNKIALQEQISINQREENRNKLAQDEQIALSKREALRDSTNQNAQIRVAELNAITSLTPLLASKDSGISNYAKMALEAVRTGEIRTQSPIKIADKADSKPPTPPKEIPVKPVLPKVSGVLNIFAFIVYNREASITVRNNAVAEVRNVAIDPKASKETQEEAKGLLSSVAYSNVLPSVIKNTAIGYLADIRSLERSTLDKALADEKVTRNVNEIVLHHTATPSIKNYSGPNVIKNIADYQVKSMGWSSPGWHYMISPDGVIWTGRNLNITPIGVPNHTEGTISVTMIFDGNNELPTQEQTVSAGLLLSLLCTKFNLDPKANFGKDRGFHSDYPSPGVSSKKDCPGKLVTKAMVLGWIAQNGK